MWMWQLEMWNTFYSVTLLLSSLKHRFLFLRAAKKRASVRLGKERGRGGLSDGPVNVLTDYPQHARVVAAARHSRITLLGPICLWSPLLSLSRFVFLSTLTLAFSSLIYPTNPSLLYLLLPTLSSFKAETVRECKRALLLCCLSPSSSRPPSVL